MLLALARALNLYGAALALGVPAALALVLLPPLRGREAAAGAAMAAVLRRAMAVTYAAILLVLVSGAAWLLLEGAAMSGGTVADAASPAVIGAVLWHTKFGAVLLTRFGFTLALGVALVVVARLRATGSRIALLGLASLCGGSGFLAIGWSGHAAATSDRFQLAADLVHLLAAGLWLGGLVALAVLLGGAAPGRESDWIGLVAGAARRFFWLGILSVAALILSGSVNSWYMVGSVPALVGTEYGHLLLLKLALFALMLAFAAQNQFRLAPRIDRATREGGASAAASALRVLRRNTLLEALLGFLVIALVSSLGTVPPGMHTPPNWPFPWRLSFDAMELPAVQRDVLVAAVLVPTGLVLATFGIVRPRRRWIAILVGLALIGAFAPSFRLLTVTAFPTSFVRSPTPYRATSIMHGAALYAANCVSCHGPRGKGDGPGAGSLAVAPADLTAAHVLDHSEGDIFWWLGNGIPESGMPGFAATLSAADRWDLVNFVRTLPVGTLDDGLTTTLADPAAPLAPDFAFRAADGTEETLLQRCAVAPTLLIFFAPDEAATEDSRLARLAASQGALAEAGLSLVAVPMAPLAPQAADPALGDIVVTAGSDVAAAYRLIATSRQRNPTAPTHLEFLVDRDGYLRALWQPGPAPASGAAGWDDLRVLVDLAATLDDHPIAASAAPAMHMHME